MSGFFASLGRNLGRLPRNLWADLRPRPQVDRPTRRVRRAFWLHTHALLVRERTLCPWTTLALGAITGTLFAALCISGALLMIYYVPTPREAYGSMLDIQHAVTFGPFLRALHRWAAHGMVVTVALHLVRVLAQGAYRQRELNWFFGLGLLVLTLGLAFTGYLLPWDQRSVWAVVVSSSLLDHLPGLGHGLKELFLGGQQVGGATLLRFYMLHVALLPTGLLILLALHLWRIRKDGGLAVSAAEADGEAEVPAWPHLVVREGLVIVFSLAVLVVFSTLVLAPLGAPPDLHHPSNPEKAPWYFLWLQEMVSYSAVVGGLVYPGLMALLLCAVPFLDREEAAVGRWFGGPATRRVLALCALSTPAVFGAMQAWYMSAAPTASAGADLLNPAAGLIAWSLLWFFLAGVLARSTRAAVLAALTVLLMGVIGWVFIGLCRGPDWVFFWPWEAWPGGL